MIDMSYCDLCGKETHHKIVLADVNDNEIDIARYFYIVECEKCSHCLLWPFPTSREEITDFYPKNYYAHSPSNIQKNAKDIIKEFLRRGYYNKSSEKRIFKKIVFFFLKNTINEPPVIENGQLCDVGCGNGEYISKIQSYGWKIYGVEPDQKAVEFCLSKGLNVKQGYAEKISYDNAKFDVLRMWNVLEHTISPMKALLEVNRVLKKDSYLLLHVPNYESVDVRIFGKLWGNLEVPRHLHHFKYNTLVLYLEKTGFRIEKNMYPGTLVSGMKKTIGIMNKNDISHVDVFIKVAKVIIYKIYYRIFKNSYRYDIGITVLAKKISNT